MGFSEHRHPKKKEFNWFLEERGQLRLSLVNKTPERFSGSRSPEGGKGGDRQKEGVQDTCSGTYWSPLVDVCLHCRSSWCPLNSSVATKKALTSWSLVFSHEEVILCSGCPARGKNTAKAALCPANRLPIFCLPEGSFCLKPFLTVAPSLLDRVPVL